MHLDQTYHTVLQLAAALVLAIGFHASASSPVQAEAEAKMGQHKHHKHGYHRTFDETERWVKKFDDPARDIWQKPEEVVKALNIQAKDSIVDIGAGTGYFSLRIARAYPEATVYAADAEEAMVRYLEEQTKERSLPNHKPLKVDPDKINFPSQATLVLVVDTYHHMDDRVAYFKSVSKQMAPGGRVAIIDFTSESPEGPPPEHRLSKIEVETEMRKAGYKLDQDIPLLPYQYFLIFKSN